MFSWSKKDTKKKPKRRSGSGAPALNEFGIPIGQASGGNDEDLEAELRALTGGVMDMEDDLELNDEGSDVEAEFMKMMGGSKGKKKKAGKKRTAKVEVDDPVPSVDTGDVDMGDDDIGDDEDGEIDENDPELLGELMDLTEADEEYEDGEEEDEEESEEKEPEKKEVVTVASMLKERLNMYKAAEAKAKENKESSRARRFSRGIKTLQQLIKKAEAGQPVLPSEIPPVIATNLKPAPPAPPAPPPEPEPVEPHPVEDMEKLAIDTKPEETGDGGDDGDDVAVPPRQERPDVARREEPEPVSESPWLTMLRERRNEYKTSALNAKKSNDLETALKHVKCVKKLDSLIAVVELGEEIDEDDIPPSLSQPPPRKRVETVTPLRFEAPDDVDVEDYEIPTTVLEALNQRLRIYTGFKDKAEETGDEADAVRNSKIVQLYAEAIKLHKAGRKVPLHKLPTPPGCPPIPIPFEVD